MRLLGVDTSSSDASVAIVENGRLVSEKVHCGAAVGSSTANPSKNNHAEILLPLIEAVLETASLSLDAISAFAVAIGPGSFTGLRIGLSTVKGLAYGCDIPVAGVSTLNACAARVGHFKGLICAILDARKKEVYAAIFRRLDGSLERLSDDEVLSCDQLAQRLCALDPSQPILLTGEGVIQYGEKLVQSIGNRTHMSEDQKLPTLAAAVALLGEAHFAAEKALSSASLSPRYLRAPEARVKAGKNALSC